MTSPIGPRPSSDHYWRRGSRGHWARKPGRRPKATASAPISLAGSGFGALIGGLVLLLLVYAVYQLAFNADTTAAADTGPRPTDKVAPAGEPAAAQPGQTSAAPAIPGQSVAQADPLTAYARQYRLLVRSSATQSSAVVATLAYNEQLTLVCHTTGPRVVSFTGGRTEVWNKVRTPAGVTGYVSDGWVLTTAAVDQLVPAC
jgi:hypothetical protein